MKVAVQLDFDGTITVYDISFLLLDTYAGDSWRDTLAEYTQGRIPVGVFNRKVFGMVKASREAMLGMVMRSDKLRVRPGLSDLINYCSREGYRTIIVSNGLTFYIEAILEDLGIKGVEVHAAENDFYPGGMRVRYVGPDGNELETGFKEAYTRMLLEDGYYTVYIGDGASDIAPARIAGRVFATGDLLKKCREEDLECMPFNDFFDVLKEIRSLKVR